MGLIAEYFVLQRNNQDKYGKKTVVLMQNGSFYECWEYDPTYCTDDKYKLDENGVIQTTGVGVAVNLSVVLNCFLTQSDKNKPYGYNNPHMIGFPTVAYEKNRNTLLANDYVVIRHDQSKEDKTKRVFAEICSPTMQIDSIIPTCATSNVVCVYIEYQSGNKYDNFLVTTGAAVIDVVTGKNRVVEFYSKTDDQICAIHELYRFLITHYPRELIIHINDLPTKIEGDNYLKYLEKNLELKRFDRQTSHINSVPSEYKKVAYQVEFFNKIFNKSNDSQGLKILKENIKIFNDKIIENLGLEQMNYGRLAYMTLLQHCYSHNTEVITKLSKPDYGWIDEDKHLILTHNAIVQLNLMSDKNAKPGEIDSLMAVLNQTKTHLGKRLLTNLLQNPMYKEEDIVSYYDMTEDMYLLTEDKVPLWLELDKSLQGLPDISRFQRKLVIGSITPKELSVLYNSYLKIISIYITIIKVNPKAIKGLKPENIEKFNEFITRFSSIINFAALECCSIESEDGNKYMDFSECPIRQGLYPDVDQHTMTMITADNELLKIVEYLNPFLSNTRGEKIKYKSKKKTDTVVLLTTTSKANVLMNAPVNPDICGVLKSHPYNASDKMITSDKIAVLCSQVQASKAWMKNRLLAIYHAIVAEMGTYEFFNDIDDFISKIDLVHSYAKIAYQNKYYRPTLMIGVESYLDVKEIRHPIIERIIDNNYVTNDFVLGGEESKGVLLFGVNQTGKSSLAKAVALNIIMAQAGCFTPSKLTFRPYNKIITRLSGDDNIFKGQSSFAVEMTELRTILRQSDQNTLVIGDELSSGTETHSGMAITGGAILSLLKKKTSFIFATHMHELLDLSFMKKLDEKELRVAHLSITYDEEKKVLIYDRKLRAGSGSSVYGLMVARSLELPEDFLSIANEILVEVTGQNKNLLETASSRYNSQVYLDVCAMCNKNKQTCELHTHHIVEQSQADSQGMIGNASKNIKNNLIVLCKECHNKLHGEKKELEVLDTSQGKMVVVKG